jgi:predicted transporter
MQEKYKRLLTNSELWGFITVMLVEVLFAIGAVCLWNWVFSKEVNMALFGTTELGILKGVILIVFLDVTNKLLKDNQTK